MKSIFFVISLFCIQQLFSWDLSKRIGFGVVQSSALKNSFPVLSLKYYQNQFLAYSLGFGIKTSTQELLLGGKIYRATFIEEHLNFFMALGAYLVNQLDSAAVKQSGYHVEVLLGAEARMPFWEHLGFTFETGLALSQVASSISFLTVGYPLIVGGVHYYF